ncbi:MAG: hypothetical protein PCFJNLEI_03427 [Verrucomicrobiae bacterium]|nr:hypothetical protein [Verrucomicrobiae bacterium]
MRPIFITTLILTGLVAGCATPNYKRAESAEKSAAAMRAGVAELQQSTEWSLAALRRLADLQDTDPHLAYLQLRNSTTDLERRTRRMSCLSARLRTRIAAYYDHWREELPAIQDEQMRLTSANRRTILIDTYNRVPPLVTQARQQSQAYTAQLRDLEKYLGHDLTPAGIQSATQFIERASQAGRKLQTDLTALTKELDTVTAALTSATR